MVRSRYQYTRNDIVGAFRAAGLTHGDTVFVTTSLGMLGIPEGVTTPDDLNALFIACLREVIGETGTLLVPTYSYTFGRDPPVFDPAMEPARIGPFPEYFRRQPGVVRSLDPMMSVAGLGPACEALFRDLPPTSYGADSLFERLIHANAAKCCSIGLGPNWTPFIHHADWRAGVPFRYDKVFPGAIVTDGVARSIDWIYSVPLLSANARADAHRLGQMATDAGVFSYAPLGRARVYVADYRDYFEFTADQQTRNAWITAVGPPGDVLAIERARVDESTPVLSVPTEPDISVLAEALTPLARHTVSPQMDAAFDILAQAVDMTVHSWPTGHNAYDWVVPEGWALRRAVVEREDGTAVLSTDDHTLGVPGYAGAFEGLVSRHELLTHLHADEAAPWARPVREDPVERHWSLCCRAVDRRRLMDAAYRVRIETSVWRDRMRVGEVVVPGTGRDSVLLVTSLGGAGLFNETLSGVLAALTLVRLRAASQNRRVTLRWLLVPGPAGLAAWHQDAPPEASRPSLGMLTLRLAGQRLPFGLQRIGDSPLVAALHERTKARYGWHDLPEQTFEDFPPGRNPLHKPLGPAAFRAVLTLARTLTPGQQGFPVPGRLSTDDCWRTADPEAVRETAAVLDAALRHLDFDAQ
jgi:aminoglycoside N3'-acetyltransferase